MIDIEAKLYSLLFSSRLSPNSGACIFEKQFDWPDLSADLRNLKPTTRTLAIQTSEIETKEIGIQCSLSNDISSPLLELILLDLEIRNLE